MDEHREIIQRAVESRRKFFDTPQDSMAESRHWRELIQRRYEANCAGDEATEGLIEAFRADLLEQHGGEDTP